MDYSETCWGQIIYKKQNWSPRDQNIAIFVFSVFNYFETNAESVVFGLTSPTSEINTIFVKKMKIMFFWLLNLDFSRKKRKS